MVARRRCWKPKRWAREPSTRAKVRTMPRISGQSDPLPPSSCGTRRLSRPLSRSKSRSRLAVPPLRSRSMAVCAKSAARRSAIFLGSKHVAVTASASLLSTGITELIRIPVRRLDKRGRLNLCGEALELAIEPFPDFQVDEQIALLTELELTVGDIDTLEDIRRTERPEHRFKRIVKDEQMCGRATSCDRKHGFVAKGLWRQDVQKGLEGAGVSRLVDRRRHDEATRFSD